MGNEVTDRDFGRLEAQVSQLMINMDVLAKNVSTLNDLLVQAKGGWRSLAWIGGIVATLAAASGWIAAHLKYTP